MSIFKVKIHERFPLQVNCGYFEALPGERSEDTLFRNSRLSAVLREDHPNCIRHVVNSPIPSLSCSAKTKRKTHWQSLSLPLLSPALGDGKIRRPRTLLFCWTKPFLHCR